MSSRYLKLCYGRLPEIPVKKATFLMDLGNGAGPEPNRVGLTNGQSQMEVCNK